MGDQQISEGGQWSNPLFGCFGDIKLCIITYFVPCYIAGKVAQAVGESCVTYGVFSVIPIANIIFGAKIRGKIREQKRIAGTFENDCILHWFCPFCVYIQEAREVAVTTVAADTSIDRQ